MKIDSDSWKRVTLQFRDLIILIISYTSNYFRILWIRKRLAALVFTKITCLVAN